MKTIVTMETGAPLQVERYEGKLKVGERNISFSDFLKGLMNTVDLDLIFEHIVNDRYDEMTGFAACIEGFGGNGNKIVNLFLEHITERFLPMGELNDMVLSIFSRVNPTPETIAQFERLMTAYLNNVRTLDGPTFNEFVLELYQRLLNSSNKDLTKQMTSILLRMLRTSGNKEQMEQIQEWIKVSLPFVDADWLKEEYEQTIKKNQYVEQYGFSTIPKGCVGISMNSKGKVYVLEVPKSQFRVKLFDLAYEAVGHPRLLFIIHTSEEAMTQVKCVAIPDNTEIHEDMEVFHYPYSNVFDDGRICWYERPKEIEMISSIPMLFLSTMNNRHLCSNIDKLYEKYQNRAFQDSELKSFKSTLKTFY